MFNTARNFIDKLGDITDRVSCECKEPIVTSDFNCGASGDDSGTTSNPVNSCFNLFQMLQRIHDPTRVSEFTNSTIDLIFTYHPGRVSESGCVLFLSVTTISFMAYIAGKLQQKEGAFN